MTNIVILKALEGIYVFSDGRTLAKNTILNNHSNKIRIITLNNVETIVTAAGDASFSGNTIDYMTQTDPPSYTTTGLREVVGEGHCVILNNNIFLELAKGNEWADVLTMSHEYLPLFMGSGGVLMQPLIMYHKDKLKTLKGNKLLLLMKELFNIVNQIDVGSGPLYNYAILKADGKIVKHTL